MHVRLLCVAALTGFLVGAAACGRSPSASTPEIRLTAPPNGAAYVEVVGLSDEMLDALEDTALTPDQWSAVLRVAVSADAPAMLGTHAVGDGAVRFTPAFPFDAGRQYDVRFDASRVPGIGESAGAPLAATVGR